MSGRSELEQRRQSHHPAGSESGRDPLAGSAPPGANYELRDQLCASPVQPSPAQSSPVLSSPIQSEPQDNTDDGRRNLLLPERARVGLVLEEVAASFIYPPRRLSIISNGCKLTSRTKAAPANVNIGRRPPNRLRPPRTGLGKTAPASSSGLTMELADGVV